MISEKTKLLALFNYIAETGICSSENTNFTLNDFMIESNKPCNML